MEHDDYDVLLYSFIAQESSENPKLKVLRILPWPSKASFYFNYIGTKNPYKSVLSLDMGLQSIQQVVTKSTLESTQPATFRWRYKFAR